MEMVKRLLVLFGIVTMVLKGVEEVGLRLKKDEERWLALGEDLHQMFSNIAMF